MSGFWDANYNITKLSKDAEGNITEIELNGRPVEVGSATLENNKTATIDVSTYTEPVVITPTSGKDGMKKATVTLSNIPEADIDGIYVSIASLYSSVFVLLSNASLTDIKHYSGEATTLETALADTEGWSDWSASAVFSSHVGNTYNTLLENAGDSTFTQFTSGTDSYAFSNSDITSTFAKLTKIN